MFCQIPFSSIHGHCSTTVRICTLVRHMDSLKVIKPILSLLTGRQNYRPKCSVLWDGEKVWSWNQLQRGSHRTGTNWPPDQRRIRGTSCWRTACWRLFWNDPTYLEYCSLLPAHSTGRLHVWHQRWPLCSALSGDCWQRNSRTRWVHMLQLTPSSPTGRMAGSVQAWHRTAPPWSPVYRPPTTPSCPISVHGKETGRREPTSWGHIWKDHLYLGRLKKKSHIKQSFYSTGLVVL